MGLHLVARPGEGDLLLPDPDHRHLQPQSRGLGGLPGRVGGQCVQGVLERAVLAEQVLVQPLVLHADNGSSFKAATLLEKLRDLHIEPSFSRPRVSNDNPYSEALFRTCKYVPDYPVNGFATLSRPVSGCSASCTGTTSNIATAAFAS